ncbi:YqiA/YcfP family alpha/beta fold hydrolase [Cellvibrio mixtus]|uniref:YqiA/YcfP family alpha/beta fold hydrolase n=1 Tax=Cellvibrio mixtus TaxID=39650 RepID=UPI000587F122|nr:YqiA/YcfP family alpha/beta fold hydrolase [Cellvibrio mixtus]
MAALLYIHGFLSSPQSFKARQTRFWLAGNYPEIDFYCPQLPPYPAETQAILESLVESLLPQPVYLMGSSLGGFWATWLAEKYNLRAILINPAVQPQNFMPAYLEVDLKSYHTDDSYRLHAQHIDEIIAADTPVTRHANYWLLVQTGDETLDYRQAVQKYTGCKQTIEEGGDHAFQGFERYFHDYIKFFHHTEHQLKNG